MHGESALPVTIRQFFSSLILLKRFKNGQASAKEEHQNHKSTLFVVPSGPHPADLTADTLQLSARLRSDPIQGDLHISPKRTRRRHGEIRTRTRYRTIDLDEQKAWICHRLRRNNLDLGPADSQAKPNRRRQQQQKNKKPRGDPQAAGSRRHRS